MLLNLAKLASAHKALGQLVRVAKSGELTPEAAANVNSKLDLVLNELATAVGRKVDTRPLDIGALMNVRGKIEEIKSNDVRDLTVVASIDEVLSLIDETVEAAEKAPKVEAEASATTGTAADSAEAAPASDADAETAEAAADDAVAAAGESEDEEALETSDGDGELETAQPLDLSLDTDSEPEATESVATEEPVAVAKAKAPKAKAAAPAATAPAPAAGLDATLLATISEAVQQGIAQGLAAVTSATQKAKAHMVLPTSAVEEVAAKEEDNEDNDGDAWGVNLNDLIDAEDAGEITGPIDW